MCVRCIIFVNILFFLCIAKHDDYKARETFKTTDADFYRKNWQRAWKEIFLNKQDNKNKMLSISGQKYYSSVCTQKVIYYIIHNSN